MGDNKLIMINSLIQGGGHTDFQRTVLYTSYPKLYAS
ncbi:hypothetical protein FOXG_22535 [Fusarium oxysporum f. sp. lycopersici 4287]|uniref:Uncharacterized protein n=1 Tax=Fusarium oxysporum f. sp. lycopersici (strain 4287 / CBS 123668 / FGSC 9935 / NRRL 34936) TaxID=426428 RepID=A0A0J9UYX8_FUSO4|nr:hypothetical protein FOXG_19320 [Fusarium oxysporum f. sp. lycopersici 4287]XP_018242641.1 hypothetical protein FOXG_19338 [Fusarium oxysporum f. sp. lycopersici 4287]XP_018244575.1 hypothetical protein FOXG_19704 [Fusarium oxysporum f. sp. lycopersici 4287]XP_018257399.1 hypothetical protein FOXG_22535 [Fusarium oxysporum f. sp. lycopersici 4287]KNB04534.1 hypothetical protein FOXG_19320 [Fusarium oxysporum f. sp. lycopersici 4287]KNB04596.1 hypothetical protein FOXG_19338 [Fusarium oxyspo